MTHDAREESMEFRDLFEPLTVPSLLSAEFLSEESDHLHHPTVFSYGSHSSFIIHYNSRRSDVALHSSHSSLG